MKSIIYVNKYGVLKIVDEPSDSFNKIPEKTIRIIDDRMSNEI